MNRVRRLLIKVLGGVTQDELKGARLEHTKLKQVLNSYTKFVNDIYFYAENYPAWKAQQEFRNFLHDTGMPLTLNNDTPERGYEYSVDEYLGRIVDAFVLLRQEVNLDGKGDDRSLWHESRLPEARGDHYLNQKQISSRLDSEGKSGGVNET